MHATATAGDSHNALSNAALDGHTCIMATSTTVSGRPFDAEGVG